MRLLHVLVVAGLVAAALGGCAKPIRHTDVSAGATLADQMVTGNVMQTAAARHSQPMPTHIFSASQLAGRTLEVASTADIALRPGEVILTFDDGPRAGKTPVILDALDRHGVKATFLMLGSAAKANPVLARQVALRGHTVGSHTYDHTDLGKLSRQAALNEIARGEAAVAEALGGHDLSPFFRFPYLSQTGYLRTTLLQGDMVVLDVDIDSKDYYSDSVAVVTERTLERLDARGSGIVLFHDIHQRTVDMLPGFLDELEARGYSVVRLVPKAQGIFGRSVITAEVDGF
ncbi:polysaccharide deacetylase family protein [Devosia sp. XJ19-1]|uniref:Chitooligosaccharide deacetylase n=1 Tax=Devosia ureilytica TaxID=2952754 RepID=A0A9Q4AM85_9HYPH|nr:polysaccharide deacetylase family protein [Devosia ureilytica]MCP8881926.1 polysaccharide deacetylase family protein [Devosia ureilytica]MCP8886188.1 polysaccharide deacetylase family protein [Devosia ureilytica]